MHLISGHGYSLRKSCGETGNCLRMPPFRLLCFLTPLFPSQSAIEDVRVCVRHGGIHHSH